MKSNLFSLSAIIAVILFLQGCDSSGFKPEHGDILFQTGDCGSYCQSIQKVTESYGDLQFTHNGIAVHDSDGVYVLEAVRNGVTKTPLKEFLQRHTDEDGCPKVAVGRLKKEHQKHIDPAVEYIRAQTGKPYNAAFTLNNDSSFYCAELIYRGFEEAAPATVFKPEPMTFNDPETNELFPGWKEYFDDLGMEVPEGEPGINPGLMSTSDELDMVHSYFCNVAEDLIMLEVVRP